MADTSSSPAHHGHAHQGHHHHGPAPDAPFQLAFGVGVALNTAFVLLEAVGGYRANSAALLSDAGHNLGDVLGLVLAWGAARLARRPAAGRYTYGLKGLTIQAALLNALLLYGALGIIFWETVQHLRDPAPVNSPLVMALAGVGILINGFSAWLFRRGQQTDLNVRGAYLHLLTDALVSAGVVMGGAVVYATGWTWVDPLLSFVILGIVGYSSWGLLRETLTLSVQAVPASVDLNAVRRFLLARPGVISVHDLHVWPLGTEEIALTAHLVHRDGADNAFLAELQQELRSRFHISHCTVQVERQLALTDAHGTCDYTPAKAPLTS